MKYIATIDSKQYHIEINDEDRITIDGQPVDLDFKTMSEGQPIYSLILGGKSYEAMIELTDEGWQVMLRGQLYQIDIEDERQRRLRMASGGVSTQSGELKLKAPMPGLIVDVPVEEGQEVAKGDNLIILESMKMQNEIKSPREGKIARVNVNAGDSVNQNQVLLILD
ncbi:MAG: biotin/lipoyl-binding protein [Anaerolineales bacterium]|jgi:acetyl/propionyl-CoA carboxylase alpha subunit